MRSEDLRHTLEAVEEHSWRIVLLASRSKRPIGATWRITQDLNEIEAHVLFKDGNIGLVCGPDSNVVVLDFDNIGAMRQISLVLPPVRIWVETGSGKYHAYFKYEDGLPAKIMWHDEKIGEIQRGPAIQHVVIPPSLHPDTGLNYKWLLDPCIPLLSLPDAWREHLKSDTVPDFIPVGDRTGQPEEEIWAGPPADELVRRALAQPGGRMRRNGVKMQCPGCRAEGRDKSRDNALVALDGRWGCAVNREHSRAIGEALGVVSIFREVLGDAADELREPTIDDLE